MRVGDPLRGLAEELLRVAGILRAGDPERGHCDLAEPVPEVERVLGLDGDDQIRGIVRRTTHRHERRRDRAESAAVPAGLQDELHQGRIRPSPLALAHEVPYPQLQFLADWPESVGARVDHQLANQFAVIRSELQREQPPVEVPITSTGPSSSSAIISA